MLTQIFDQEVPLTEQDVIGSDDGPVKQRNFVKKIYGQVIEGRPISAIQLSTAAGLVAVLELYNRGRFAPGFIEQEDIALADFFSTH